MFDLNKLNHAKTHCEHVQGHLVRLEEEFNNLGLVDSKTMIEICNADIQQHVDYLNHELQENSYRLEGVSDE